jgi:tripartite-type tricarboxylate transporter receptor subunit TctC
MNTMNLSTTAAPGRAQSAGIQLGRSRARRALAALGLAIATIGSAGAQQAWPSKPIRMIVGYTPGGFTDQMARIVGEPVGRALGTSMLFDYKPGANSMIGADMVAKAAPDGYTLGTVIAAHSANPSLYAKMPFDAIADFTPVAVTGISPLILVANNDFPPKTVAELVAYAKANPGKLNFGSSGKGAAAHLGMEHFMSLNGLKMQHIPYKGTQPALTDLISGQIQLMFDTASSMWPHVRAGKIKALGIAADARLAGFPDLPTFADGGVPFVANTWSMILAPAKTPPEIVSRLNAEAMKVLATPAVRERLDVLGIVPGTGSPKDAAAFLQSEVAKYGKIVRDAGVSLDN